MSNPFKTRMVNPFKKRKSEKLIPIQVYLSRQCVKQLKKLETAEKDMDSLIRLAVEAFVERENIDRDQERPD